MTRFAFITLRVGEHVSDEELGTELRKNLKSRTFSVEHIAILDNQQAEDIHTYFSRVAKTLEQDASQYQQAHEIARASTKANRQTRSQ
ncbi:MAG TPA: hypothetical protein VLV31_07035 [Candidatus Acidoferrales bacterium]|nr:hypothetical protein [Candidatus Acidoferrales bacterium]